MVKAAEIEKLRYLLDKPENKPLKQLLEKLSDENDDLQKEVDTMVPPDEFAQAEEAAEKRGKLVEALFALMYDVENGAIDAHVYRKEKRELWRWADSLGLEVFK